MGRAYNLTMSVIAASLLVTSMAAPADARRYRHWDRHDGIDVGDVIVGAIIIGGIAVVASEIGKSRDRNGTVYGGPAGERADDENAAVDACSVAAEARASEAGLNGRVANITSVDRNDHGYRIRGTIEYEANDWRGSERRVQDMARFICSFNHGQVENIWVDDGRA